MARRVSVSPSSLSIAGSESRSVLDKGPTTSWASIKTMPKEISQYAVDPQILTDIKKKDIELHSNDDKRDAFQRAVICMKSGQPSEMIYVASKFDHLVKENTNRAFEEVFPSLAFELKKSPDSEFHLAASVSMIAACRLLYGKGVSQAKDLLKFIFQLVEVENAVASDIWTRALGDLMGYMSPKDLDKEFAPVIFEKARNKNSINSRRAACLLLRRLLKSTNPDIVAHVQSTIPNLCNDPNPIIRGNICMQLPAIYEIIPKSQDILANLNTLSKDPVDRVRICFMSTIVKLIKQPSMKFLCVEAVSLIKRAVKEAYVKNNIDLLIEFSSTMGEVAQTLSDAGALDANNKLWWLDAFLHLSKFGLKGGTGEVPTGIVTYRANTDYNRRKSYVESLIGTNEKSSAASVSTSQAWIIRQNAAKQFLAFLKFAKPVVDFKSGLHPIMVDLIHDTNPKVRASMAENVWPIMEMLGPAGHMLSGEFVYALADDDMQVLEAIVPNMNQILQVLVQGKVLSKDTMTPATVEVVGAIMFCEERLHKTHNWRIHSSLLSQLSVLPYCVPSDYIFTNVVPNMFHRLRHLKPLPSRLAASDAIISFLRNCRRAGQREEIRRGIKESFAMSRSAQDRMLYLFMSKMIIDNFSRKYYRQYFFEETLSMAEDNVSNVRMKAVALIPDMKGTLKTAEDDTLSKKLEETLKRIQHSETDGDVQAALQDAIIEMKKLGVVFDKSKGKKTRDDLDDEAKEKEENYIVSLEKYMPAFLSNSKAKDGNKNRPSSVKALPLPPKPNVKALPSPTPAPPSPMPGEVESRKTSKSMVQTQVRLLNSTSNA